MADSLSSLRQYRLDNRLDEIVEKDGHIIFGEFSWPANSQTNFIKYSTKGEEKEYYTLGCLLYFLKNQKEQHGVYVKQAGSEGIPVVSRPDRKDLEFYLTDPKSVPSQIKKIDKSATLVVPTTVKRRADNKLESDQAKKAKIDSKASEQEIRDKLFANKTAEPLSIRKTDLRDLTSDSGVLLTKDRIAELRAKRFANRRGQISEDVNVDIKAPSLSKEITFKHEKQYRTRTTILESTGKTFSTCFATLSSIKAREEGKMVKPPQQTPRPGGPMMPPPMQPQRTQLPNYNRYDQEQFIGGKDTHGFNIDTTGTFSGMTLRSVTEGNASARNKQQQQAQPHQPASNNSNGVVKNIPPSSASNNSPNTGGKRPSRTPIIIISAAPKSLITMYNAKEILQDLRFISTEDMKAKGGGMKRDNEVLIQRRKEGGTVPYRVIDNPSKLTQTDWDRVVAVFVMGQAWQFKNWPWGGNPTVIFSKICAFHFKWDDANLDKNIANWACQVIPLSRNQRHLDRARLKTFWDVLDRYMVNNKPHLRF